jgi:hypothetical protein
MIEDSKLVAALRDSEDFDETDLDRALEISNETGRPLYHTLIDHELTDEIATVRVAADLLNVPFVDLSDVRPPAEVIEKVPPSLAFRNMVFPLKIDEQNGEPELLLAMADPIDVLAMDEVATHTGIDIRPVLAGRRDLRRALDRAYSPDDSSESLEGVEPFGDDFDLGEISSLDRGSELDEDSWEAFFDEAEESDEEEELEDSMVLSREMRDRRTSQELEPFEDVEESEAGDIDEDEALQSLEEPLSESQMTGGVEADLSEWEVDQRLEGADEDEDGEKDYAAIGSFFVYSSEDARKQRLQEIADFKEKERADADDAQTDSEEDDEEVQPADTSNEEVVPEVDRSSEGAEEISGVTSMSKAPFMFDESEAGEGDVDSDSVDDEFDEDSGDHTMVGRGVGFEESSGEDAAAAPPDVDDEEEEHSGTSMLGGPFGIGTGDDDDTGPQTAVESAPLGERDSSAETVDGEVEVLDEDEIEILEDSEADLSEDSFGSQTQFGVGPGGGSSAEGAEMAMRAPSSQSDAADRETRADDGGAQPSGDQSDAPLAQVTSPKDDEADDTAEVDEESAKDESTKSRLSGLLDNIRAKNKRKDDAESDEQSDTSEQAAEEVADRGEQETEENPAAKTQADATSEGSENIRETRPNKAVTVLRAQAMQEDAGLASVFAKHVAGRTELTEDELSALTELSPEELIYVTMLALFDKGVLEPRDILAQFQDEEQDD